MARTARIHYQRITLSFPSSVVERLHSEAGQNNMSKYAVEALEDKFKKADNEEEDVDNIFRDLKKLRESISKSRVDKRSSLEILREIRYGEK